MCLLLRVLNGCFVKKFVRLLMQVSDEMLIFFCNLMFLQEVEFNAFVQSSQESHSQVHPASSPI